MGGRINHPFQLKPEEFMAILLIMIAMNNVFHLFSLSFSSFQTREQLQAENQRYQTKIEDLEKALAQQGQVSIRCLMYNILDKEEA